MTRPLPGSVTVREVRVQVCTECGWVITSQDCKYGCPLHDTHWADRPIDKVITAVYERTNKFLRDEKGGV